jgi:hypothetical protein
MDCICGRRDKDSFLDILLQIMDGRRRGPSHQRLFPFVILFLYTLTFPLGIVYGL